MKILAFDMRLKSMPYSETEPIKLHLSYAIMRELDVKTTKCGFTAQSTVIHLPQGEELDGDDV